MLPVINGKFYQTDGHGYLVNFEDWNIKVALYLASEESVEMTDEHWEVVNFMREYYEKYKICPSMNIPVKAIGKKLGPEKRNINYIYKLFSGHAWWGNQACKIAGFSGPTDYGFVLDDKIYQTDWNGNLLNFWDWNKEIAEYLAKEENIEMTDEHWEVVNLLRDFYEEYKHTPISGVLIKLIARKLGWEKDNARKYLYELFPKGAMQASEIAGLPMPTGGP